MFDLIARPVQGIFFHQARQLFRSHYVAHRCAVGENALAENTLCAFNAAQRLFMHIEFDVRLTKCQTPVVYHDESVTDKDDHSVPIDGLTYQEVQTINKNILPLSKWLEHLLPTTHLLIDLKGRNPGLIKALSPILATLHPTQFTCIVFQPTLADAARRAWPKSNILQLTEAAMADELGEGNLQLRSIKQIEPMLDALVKRNIQGIGVQVEPNSQDKVFWHTLVQQAHQRGLKVQAWFHHQDEVAVGKIWYPILQKAGVDWINTDFPRCSLSACAKVAAMDTEIAPTLKAKL